MPPFSTRRVFESGRAESGWERKDGSWQCSLGGEVDRFGNFGEGGLDAGKVSFGTKADTEIFRNLDLVSQYQKETGAVNTKSPEKRTDRGFFLGLGVGGHMCSSEGGVPLRQ